MKKANVTPKKLVLSKKTIAVLNTNTKQESNNNTKPSCIPECY
ncbi:class I lanthipeptide [Taibaiella sp. KBW10]